MAGFKTHIGTSTTLGVIYGTIGYVNGVPLSTCAVAAGLSSVGGMIPDMDGDTGVPVRETTALVAVGVPALLIGDLHNWGLNREEVALTVGALYLIIRFGIGSIFKLWTRHRGMWHSIPAAINVGLIAFLLVSGPEIGTRLFKASAIVMGILSHLILDEIYSVDLKKFRLKNSFGTAFKLWSPRVWPTLMTYTITACLLILTYSDEGVKDYVDEKIAKLQQTVNQTAMESEPIESP